MAALKIARGFKLHTHQTKVANMNTTRTPGRHVNDWTQEPATPRSCATFRSLWKPLGVFIFGLLFYSQELLQAQLEAAEYTFEEIIVPGATEASANGNSTHEIAGDFTDSNGVTHGFVLSKGAFTTVDVPGAAFTQINGINAPGRFAGTYSNSGDLENDAQGYFSSKGVFVTINPSQSSRTQVGFLNAQGEVVGTFRDAQASQKRRGFIWKDGHVTTIFNVPGDHPVGGTVAFGINDKGETVGNYAKAGEAPPRRHGFFRSSKGEFTTFDVPGAIITIGEGINNQGTIVGVYVNEADFSVHGFVLRNGIFETVDVPGAVETQVFSINSKGEIVGSYVDAADVEHGFVGTPIR
jgi:uncharacterized membrane protein